MNRVLCGRGWVVLFLFLLEVSTSLSFAQLPTATILGVVKDSSGAVVPDVNLTARNVDTGQTRTAVSAADGSYRFSALPVGSYEVLSEHTGFQTGKQTGLTLTISQEAVVNITLQLGAVEQTVSVTAESPLVNTTSGTLGGLVDEQKVADLPLNGRNYAALTSCYPECSKTISTGAAGGLLLVPSKRGSGTAATERPRVPTTTCSTERPSRPQTIRLRQG